MWRNVEQRNRKEINNNGTIRDLQVTSFFLSMCSQNAIIKLKGLMNPRNLIDIPYKDIRLAIHNYISPKQSVVMTERAKFLSVIQSVWESDDNLLARLRENARYCDFEKLKTAASPEEQFVKIKLISGLRDQAARLRLIDSIKAKPAISVTEMTENLHFRSQAMVLQVLDLVISLLL